MNTELACEKALLFKKSKAMSMIFDSQIFAVRLSNGEIGYISVLGMTGDRQGLMLYIGENGLNSLQKFLRIRSRGIFAPRFYFDDYNCCADYLSCEFTIKASLTNEECATVTACAKKLGIRPGGKNFYPVFLKSTPMHFRSRITEQAEIDLLAEALEAAVEMLRLLDSGRENLFLSMFSGYGETTLLSKENGKWTESRITIDPPKPTLYVSPKFYNDIAAAKLKKFRKKGTWLVMVKLSDHMLENSDEILMEAVVIRMDKIRLLPRDVDELPFMSVTDYDNRCGQLLDKMAEMFVEIKICPKEIRVHDPISFAFVKDFCDRLDIGLEFISEESQGWDYDEEDLYEDLDEEDFYDYENVDLEDIDDDYDYDYVFYDLNGNIEETIDKIEEMYKREGQVPDVAADVLEVISGNKRLPDKSRRRAKELLNKLTKD